jgi:hypothetical protein
MRRRWIYVLAASFAGLFYLAFTHQSPAEPGSGMSADRLCRRLLQEKSHTEALAWMQQSKRGDIRMVGEQNSSDSLKIVQRLYDAGAVQVHAVDLDRVAGVGETTNTLCVELPNDAGKRQKLFKIEKRVAGAGGFDPVSDDGQAYMFLNGFKMWFLP